MAAQEIFKTTLFNHPNLKAYYRLESGLFTTDTKGGFTLTNNNSVATATGKFGGGADTGSSNSNKSMSVANNIGIDGGPITISCWVNITTAPSSGQSAAFVQQANTTSKTGYFIEYNNNSGTLRVRFNRTRFPGDQDQSIVVGTLTTGVWHNLILVYDGTNIWGFIDGVKSTPAAATGNGGSGGGNSLSLFNRAVEGNLFFSGLLDDVAIFNDDLDDATCGKIYAGGLRLRIKSGALLNFVK